MSTFTDLRLAARLLIKDRWLTVAATSALALGIAATRAMSLHCRMALRAWQAPAIGAVVFLTLTPDSKSKSRSAMSLP